MNSEQEFHGPNLAYMLGLRERYETDPDSLDPATREFFERVDVQEPGPGAQAVADLKSVIATANLAQAIRSQGYLAANLNPLFKGTGDPSLTLEYYQLKEEDLTRLPAWLVDFPGLKEGSALDAIAALRGVYCGTIGFDYAHVHSPEEQEWLHQTTESGRFRDSAQDMNEVKLLSARQGLSRVPSPR